MPSAVRPVSSHLATSYQCAFESFNKRSTVTFNLFPNRDQGCIQVSLGILGKLLKLTSGVSDHLLDGKSI